LSVHEGTVGREYLPVNQTTRHKPARGPRAAGQRRNGIGAAIVAGLNGRILLQAIPVRQSGRRRPVACGVSFFASAREPRVTGQVICVDGGRRLL
jgi:NAD(P)-dependent dehydrogenase (short-subunit alcohol dehydrogenase family)